jgi:hypothetical protein
MIWPLIKLDLKKALATYLVLLLVQIVFILSTRDILDSSNVTVVVLALAQGWMLAWRIFRDAPHTRSFLFSRPWSRTRIFWNRWILAVTLQSITVLLIYVILAAGTRTLIYQTQLPYFPMVERFELSILWPIALASVIAFHIVMFLILWGQLGYNPGSTRVWHGIVVKIAFAIMLMSFIGGGTLTVRAVSSDAGLRTGDLAFTGDWAFVYAVALVILCTGAARNCLKHMEIES